MIGSQCENNYCLRLECVKVLYDRESVYENNYCLRLVCVKVPYDRESV